MIIPVDYDLEKRPNILWKMICATSIQKVITIVREHWVRRPTMEEGRLKCYYRCDSPGFTYILSDILMSWLDCRSILNLKCVSFNF